MFGIVNQITITQQSTEIYPNRSKVFSFNFLTSGNGDSTWSHLTDTFHVIMPRKIYFRDLSTDKVTTWKDEAIYGNPATPPKILRGDKIKVEMGYFYFSPTGDGGFDRNKIVTQLKTRFEGFISRIKNSTPFELECKDNMFILQQTKVTDKEWVVDGKAYTVETMLKEMLKGSTHPDAKKLTIKTDNYKHAIQKFHTYGWTMAQVLEDLRTHYKLESFFRGTELRTGVIRYYPQDKVRHSFHFQKNVSDDNLDYQRKDDLRIGIIAKSINKVEVQTNNSNGKAKTKHTELKVNVGDQDGELRTLFFWGIESTKELKRLAEKKLPFLKYEGFRGHFTSFGLPFVKHGDEAELIDDLIPERNGIYLVKQVETMNTNAGGLKQRIYLDIRIDGLKESELNDFQSNGL